MLRELPQPHFAPHGESGGSLPRETLRERLEFKEQIYSKVPEDIQQQTIHLIGIAQGEASKYVQTPEGRRRVDSACWTILRHAIAENLTVARQIDDPSYKGAPDPEDPSRLTGFRPDTMSFLDGVRPAGKVCSEDREHQFAIGDPKVFIYSRSPGGFIETSPDSDGNERVTNLQHRAAIAQTLGVRLYHGRHKDNTAEYVQFHGPHGDLESPTSLDDICAGIRGQIESQGGGAVSDYRFAGIDYWFKSTERQFHAFDLEALRNNGRSTTFDMTFNTHNQELVFGLRNAFLEGKIDPSKSLQANLDDVGEEIVRTSDLAARFRDDTRSMAEGFGIEGSIDFRDYTQFLRNIVAVGTTGRHLAGKEVAKGFPNIPLELKLDRLVGSGRVSERALRALAYTAYRNAAYLVLTGEKSGDANPMQHHVAEMLAIGETGAHFNYLTPALIHGAPAREFGQIELDAVQKLAAVEKHTLEHLGYDPLETARIIRVTGAFDPERYAPEVRDEELLLVAERLRENADRVRRLFPHGVRDGQIMVIGSIHNPRTRELTHIV